jgi:hypothetical protein
MDPLPGYGVTTTIMGNCGFSAAPVHDDPAVRREMVGIFSFFEDIPEKPFLQELPWDWKTWPEYRQSMTSKVKTAANYGAFVGHIAIRLAAMGMDAWNRAATADEIARMAGMLDEALAAGAMGLSTNFLDHDGNDRPVPTLLADDAPTFVRQLRRLHEHPLEALRLAASARTHWERLLDEDRSASDLTPLLQLGCDVLQHVPESERPLPLPKVPSTARSAAGLRSDFAAAAALPLVAGAGPAVQREGYPLGPAAGGRRAAATRARTTRPSTTSRACCRGSRSARAPPLRRALLSTRSCRARQCSCPAAGRTRCSTSRTQSQ